MGQQPEGQATGSTDMVAIGQALWARQCRGERIDALECLPYFRLQFLRQRKAGHSLAFTEYGDLLKRAMKPVLLPPDFAVSSETAAHFNRLLRTDAERDARAAAQNHEFVMGHFERLLGKAA